MINQYIFGEAEKQKNPDESSFPVNINNKSFISNKLSSRFEL